MKRNLKISALILVWFLASAKGCDDRNRSDTASDLARERISRDSLAAVFSTDTLPAATLLSFEMAAISRLSDLADYLKIFADRSVDTVFRNKSGEMIRKIFISEDVRLWGYIPIPENMDMRVRDLHNAALNYLPPMINMRFDSVRVTQSMRQVNDTLCSGRMSYVMVFIGGPYDPIAHTGDMFALKQWKIFGKDTLKVWEVKLGEIHSFLRHLPPAETQEDP